MPSESGGIYFLLFSTLNQGNYKPIDLLRWQKQQYISF